MFTFTSFGAHSAFFEIPKDEDVLFPVRGSRGERSALNPAKIDLLIWNVFKGSKEGWNQDFLKMAEGKDLLLLQEVVSATRMMDAFKKNMSHFSIVTSYFSDSDSRTRTGIAVGSPVQPLLTSWTRSYYREPIVGTPKMVSYTEFDLEGVEENLLVVNIHAINFVTRNKFEHMIRQAFERMAIHRGPIVFGGDFNTWTRSKRDALFSYVKDHRFTEVSFRNDERMTMFGLILDYVFVRDLKVEDAFVHGEVDSSDHKAMEVSLSYEGE